MFVSILLVFVLIIFMVDSSFRPNSKNNTNTTRGKTFINISLSYPDILIHKSIKAQEYIKCVI